MYIAYIAVAVATIAANLGMFVADVARAKSVLANSAEVRVPPSWMPLLAGLKAAGAAGIALGLFGVPYIGVAAAAGLVLFFIGAVAAHVRARVFHNIYFPGGYLALAVGTLVLDLAR